MLDTFFDRRRAYGFAANPLGVQWDATWTEGEGFDETFDTVWESRGALTDGGYVVLFAVPFESLRFASGPEQRWGVVLLREIPRGQAEESFWPAVSSRVEGRLSQAAAMRIPGRLSPSRDVQLIPYATGRSYRLLEEDGAAGPGYLSDAEPDAGLDAKLVVDDSLVFDATANPDFSQVESDEPRVTVNRRFEVFFPERRPFFLENAGTFETPLDLVFTRRIADPRLGLAFGGLLIDDQAPGKTAAPGSPLAGAAARFAIARVDRDLGEQSSLGALFTERTLEGDANRVAGIDARVKLDENWVAAGQAVASWTRDAAGERAGPAYQLELERSGRQLEYSGRYTDIGGGFHTEAGFVPRTRLRETSHFLGYFFRPEGRHLISWGPELFLLRNWDRSGLRLDGLIEASLEWPFTGQTALELNYRRSRERLRPRDAPGLEGDSDFATSTWVLEYETSFIDELEVEGSWPGGSRSTSPPRPASAPPSPTGSSPTSRYRCGR